LALLGLVSALTLALWGERVLAQTPEESFFQAGIAYREGRFQEAADLYERLVRSGQKSGPLFYNLGNAHFRMGRLGPAIVNYERARWFMPRDPDLDFNLRLARERCLDALQDRQDLLGNIFFWMEAFNLKEFFWSFAALNIAFWGILALRAFVRAEALFYVGIVLFAAWLLAGASLGLKAYGASRDDRAIVLADEVNVMAGPDEKETVLFKLHAGAAVREERSEAGWSLIRLSDERRGWVRGAAVERIMGGWSPSHRPRAGSGEVGR
jgi:tetratricopeptide (TPR) repeat protein